MSRFMFDTDFCVRIVKRLSPTLSGRFEREAQRICISTVVLGELTYGAEKSARRAENLAAVSAFVARLPVLDFDRRAAEHFGELRAELAKLGQPIGPYDTMIAAHARSQGLVLVTGNVREFSRVPGLRVETWV